MERLTSNKAVEEMSMVELAHNCCYAKDRLARYRDFEMDMDARDFARNLMTTLTDDELPLDDDNFDEEILENLMYDPFSNVKGLIALFYRNLWAMADNRERLKEYEDAEEQGLLLRLPCKEGTEVYVIDSMLECKHDYDCPLCSNAYKCEEDIPCEHQYIQRFIRKTRFVHAMINNIGKTVFLTKEEAEQALKQMGE